MQQERRLVWKVLDGRALTWNPRSVLAASEAQTDLNEGRPETSQAQLPLVFLLRGWRLSDCARGRRLCQSRQNTVWVSATSWHVGTYLKTLFKT